MPHLIDSDTGWCMLCQKYEHERLQRSKSLTSLDIESSFTGFYPDNPSQKIKLKRSATSMGIVEKIFIETKKENISNVPKTAPNQSIVPRKVQPSLLTVPLGNNHLENIKEEEEHNDNSKDTDDENYENVYIDVNSGLNKIGHKETDSSKEEKNEETLKKIEQSKTENNSVTYQKDSLKELAQPEKVNQSININPQKDTTVKNMLPVSQPLIIAQQPMSARQPYALMRPIQPSYVIRDPRLNPIIQLPNMQNIVAIVPTIKKPIEKPKVKETTVIKTFSVEENKNELEVAKYYEPFYKYYDLETGLKGTHCCTCFVGCCRKSNLLEWCENLVSCPVYMCLMVILPFFIILFAGVIIMGLYYGNVIRF